MASTPKIGLALGGGGVRGLAHVGVLRVFVKAGIPVHAIAGTSIGAIVGAAYALNPEFGRKRLLRELQELHLTPATVLHKRNGKFSLSAFFHRLRFAERFVTANLRGWGVLTDRRLPAYLLKVTAGRNLEDSPIPLAVVTTDLKTGEPVILREGPAARAILASCALPAFFPPVQLNGHLLGDGAFVNMVPADVVRTMGVDVVIAVDVGQDDIAVDVRNGLEAWFRAIEICARHHKHFHLQAADLVIRPQFGEAVFALDFTKMRRCIEAGIRAARKALPEILTLAHTPELKKCMCNEMCECELES
ncbi:patatin-like phospholipase family protein [bacterium]|nr:patatin-like phospholipase family protein [bacterium]